MAVSQSECQPSDARIEDSNVLKLLKVPNDLKVLNDPKDLKDLKDLNAL